MEFTSNRVMKKAERELNGAELNRRELRVNLATPRGDGGRGGRDRGGGGVEVCGCFNFSAGYVCVLEVYHCMDVEC